MAIPLILSTGGDIQRLSTTLNAPGNIVAVGDLTAAGGFRQTIGGWLLNSVANMLTAQQIGMFSSINLQNQWVACRPGSVTGFSIIITVAAAGGDLTADIYLNGNPSGITLLIVNGTTQNFAIYAKDFLPFSAGDKLDVRVTTPVGWTAVLGYFSAFIEVEM